MVSTELLKLNKTKFPTGRPVWTCQRTSVLVRKTFRAVVSVKLNARFVLVQSQTKPYFSIHWFSRHGLHAGTAYYETFWFPNQCGLRTDFVSRSEGKRALFGNTFATYLCPNTVQ